MESILVHGCCAHCAAYTVKYWRERGYAVSVFWYNPNIHPCTEHQHRLAAMKSLAGELDLPLHIQEGYDPREYFRRVVGQEDKPERCRQCFRLRLTRTAGAAAERGFRGFTTTLLISPHQEHELIREAGEEAAAGAGTEFFYADLRKRYSDSRHISKKMDLYRQQYCGCLYSEWERYAGQETE